MWTPEDRALVGDYGAGQALTGDRWRLLQPLIPPAKPGGRPRTADMRRMLDSLFYVLRTPASGGTYPRRPPSCRGRPFMATSAPSWTRACGSPCATASWPCCARVWAGSQAPRPR